MHSWPHKTNLDLTTLDLSSFFLIVLLTSDLDIIYNLPLQEEVIHSHDLATPSKMYRCESHQQQDIHNWGRQRKSDEIVDVEHSMILCSII